MAALVENTLHYMWTLFVGSCPFATPNDKTLTPQAAGFAGALGFLRVVKGMSLMVGLSRLKSRISDSILQGHTPLTKQVTFSSATGCHSWYLFCEVTPPQNNLALCEFGGSAVPTSQCNGQVQLHRSWHCVSGQNIINEIGKPLDELSIIGSVNHPNNFFLGNFFGSFFPIFDANDVPLLRGSEIKILGQIICHFTFDVWQRSIGAVSGSRILWGTVRWKVGAQFWISEEEIGQLWIRPRRPLRCCVPNFASLALLRVFFLKFFGRGNVQQSVNHEHSTASSPNQHDILLWVDVVGNCAKAKPSPNVYENVGIFSHFSCVWTQTGVCTDQRSSVPGIKIGIWFIFRRWIWITNKGLHVADRSLPPGQTSERMASFPSATTCAFCSHVEHISNGT